MKIVRFVMSKGDPINLPLEKAEKVIDSENQMVKITDKDGNWTGELINKSFLICTQIDREASREANKELEWQEKGGFIEAPKDTLKVSELIKKYRPEFLDKNIEI